MEEKEIDFFKRKKKKKARLLVSYSGELKFWEMEKGLRFDLFAKLLSYSKSVHLDFSLSQQKVKSESSP